MSLALVYSRALSGMNAPLVEVEAHLANGLPHFNIVGLPDTEVKESRDRVRAAIIQSGFDFPAKISTSLPKKSPSTSPPPTCPKNRDVSTCRLRWASLPHPDKSHPKSSRNTSLPANWRFPACCAPCAARWRWRGRVCRRDVLSSYRRKTQNKPP